MNYSKVRFTLDMHKNQAQVSVPVSVGDTAKKFYISFTDGGLPFFIPDGCLAMMSIKRPTGTTLQAFCTIENNTTVKYDFSENESTAIVSGIHDCDLVLYDLDGKQITSPKFTMVVDERVVNREDIDLTDEDYTIVDAMVRAEASRQVAETERVEAEALRIASEKTRETDDQNRDVRFNAAIKAAEEATVRANEAANKNGVDGKDGVSPTVKVESISGGHKVTITDKDGDKSFNVMDGATVNDVIAALPKYNGEVVDV